jgi:uracil-DNA glycosylase family 4
MIDRGGHGRRKVAKTTARPAKGSLARKVTSVAAAATSEAKLTAERAAARAASQDVERRPDISCFPAGATYDPECTRCPRLASFLTESHARYPSYWSRPVPSFGSISARIAIVGLAPGMHGANRSARPFTGDYAGLLLYQTLYDLGLASHPRSTAYDDSMKLKNVRILNAVKCVPPENKPTPDEIRRCNDFLKAELAAMKSARVYVALGLVAHEAILKALGRKRTEFKFGHAAEARLGEALYLLDSYHCSRYNTQTRRLTPEMFRAVLARACELAQV